MFYVVHIRSKYKKHWHFCKKFVSYDSAYDFITKPKTYLYNGRYNSSKSRFYRISICQKGLFSKSIYYVNSKYFAAFPCILNDKTYMFNHIKEIDFEDILEHE